MNPKTESTALFKNDSSSAIPGKAGHRQQWAGQSATYQQNLIKPRRKIQSDTIIIIGKTLPANFPEEIIRQCWPNETRITSRFYEIYGEKPRIYSKKMADSEESSAFCRPVLPRQQRSPPLIADGGVRYSRVATPELETPQQRQPRTTSQKTPKTTIRTTPCGACLSHHAVAKDRCSRYKTRKSCISHRLPQSVADPPLPGSAAGKSHGGPIQPIDFRLAHSAECSWNKQKYPLPMRLKNFRHLCTDRVEGTRQQQRFSRTKLSQLASHAGRCIM